jgi:hypothetical protein
LPFEFLSGYSYDFKGSRTIAGKSDRNGWNKRQATIILYIMADSSTPFKPMIIFHGKGTLHSVTVECDTIRARFHNTCGNHRAARDIYVYLLEKIADMGVEAANGRHDLINVTMDQAKRLKRAYHQKTEEDDKGESLYSSLLRNAQNTVNHLLHGDKEELKQAMALDGEKRETKWKMPEDWSLPLEGEM